MAQNGSVNIEEEQTKQRKTEMPGRRRWYKGMSVYIAGRNGTRTSKKASSESREGTGQNQPWWVRALGKRRGENR